MEDGGLAREQVLPLLGSGDEDLQRAALRVVIARPAWADGVADLLFRWLTDRELPEGHRNVLQAALLALSKQPAVQEVISRALKEDATPVASRLLLLESVGQ